MLTLQQFPALNASLNGLTALLLTAGFIAIKRGNKNVHASFMISAFATSVVFLGCYLTYHYFRGVTKFTTPGWPSYIYFAILGTHTLLAIAVLPLVLRTLYLAANARFDAHRRIARWTWPIWMYVSVTGVIVYVMLYHLYRPV